MPNYKKLVIIILIIITGLCLRATALAATTTTKTVSKTLTTQQTTTIATATSTKTGDASKIESTNSTYTTPAQTKTVSPQPDPPGSSTAKQATTSQTKATDVQSKIAKPITDVENQKVTSSIQPAAIGQKATYLVEIKTANTLSTSLPSELSLITTTTRTKTDYETDNTDIGYKITSADEYIKIKIKEKRIEVKGIKTVDPAVLAKALEEKPAVLTALLSSFATGSYYNVKIMAKNGVAEAKFKYNGQDVSFDINNDLILKNKKLFLLQDKDEMEIKLLPPELYSHLKLKIKNNNAQLGQIKLSVQNKKPIYELDIKEPFKLLWFLPIHIPVIYAIDGQDTKVMSVNQPWYAFLGKFSAQTILPQIKLVQPDGQFSLMETEYPRIIIDTFSAANNLLDSEYGSVRLYWNTRNAYTIQIQSEPNSSYVPIPVIGLPVPVPANGYVDVYPNVKTKYTLVVSNRGGMTAERTVEVDVRLSNIIIKKVEPSIGTYSILKGKKGYTDMDVVFRNIGSIDFLGIISVDEISGGDYHYLTPNFIADIQSGRELKYHFYRGELPRGMVPIENFVCGQTYIVNIRYRTDKQPRWEYATDNVWASRSITIPDC